MSVYPSLSRQVAPGPTQFINVGDIGNAGNGGQPNPPTIVPQYPGTFPRVNLNPKFKIGEYNNAEESYHFPRFFKAWEMQRNTNNPIGNYSASSVGLGVPGNAANGYNKATQGRIPMPWAPYNPRVLGVQGGDSQSYPYNENQTTVEGQLVLRQPYGFNVNMGEEQQIGAGMPVFTIEGTLGNTPIKLEGKRDSGLRADPGGGRAIPRQRGSNMGRLENKQMGDMIADGVQNEILRLRGPQ